MKENVEKIEQRMLEIRQEMSTIGPVLFGDISVRRHKYVKADGTVSFQKSQPVFRFAKTGGRQQKRIPHESEAAVRKMICDGKRYVGLREEYEVLLSRLSLLGALKKTSRGATAGNGESRRRDGRSPEKKRGRQTS